MKMPNRADSDHDMRKRRVESLLALILYCMDEACELNMDHAARFLDAASLSIVGSCADAAKDLRRDLESALSNPHPPH